MTGTRSGSSVQNESLGSFERNQRALVSLASRTATVVGRLGMEDRARALTQLAARIGSEQSRILVIGEFKRGKSTLVNALLGEEVLPSSVVPCTALISEIKWGKWKRLFLHFRHPLPSPLPEGLSPDLMVHLRNGGGYPAPLEIPVDRLADYLVIRDPWKDPADAAPDALYSHVEVFWPAELLRHGIEIVDSPGLNAQRDPIAREYIARADAILFVLGCNGLASQSELRFIDKDLDETERENLLFVCNRFDEIRESDRPIVMTYGRERLVSRTGLGEAGVVFLSAREALSARSGEGGTLLEKSGLLALESALAVSLTSGRHRLKLLQPARELIDASEEARGEMRVRSSSLEQDLARLEAKVAQATDELDIADRACGRILARIDEGRRRLRWDAIHPAASEFLSELAERLCHWMENVALQRRSPSAFPGFAAQVEDAAKEVCRDVGVRLGKEIAKWRLAGLEPLVAAWFETMVQEVSPHSTRFFSRIERIRDGFLDSGGAGAEHSQGMTRGEEIGAEFLARVFAYSVLTRMLEGSHTILLLPIFLGQMSRIFPFINGFWLWRLKGHLSRVFVGCFQAELATLANLIAEEIHTRTREISRTAEDLLWRELQAARDQLHAAALDLRARQEQAAAQRGLFSEIESEIQDLQLAVHRVIVEVAGDRPGPKMLDRSAEPPSGGGAQRILFLAADPFGELRLAVELRNIREQLARTAPPDMRSDVRIELAVRMEDLTRALNEHSPDIVHFAGHGEEDGTIYLLNGDGQPHPIAPCVLAELFDLVSNRIECIVLNCCHSQKLARAIRKRIRYVIGMRRDIEDKAAIAFSVGFYQALGAGRSVESAFRFGCVQTAGVDLREGRNPALWKEGYLVTARSAAQRRRRDSTVQS